MQACFLRIINCFRSVVSVPFGEAPIIENDWFGCALLNIIGLHLGASRLCLVLSNRELNSHYVLACWLRERGSERRHARDRVRLGLAKRHACGETSKSRFPECPAHGVIIFADFHFHPAFLEAVRLPRSKGLQVALWHEASGNQGHCDSYASCVY